MPHMLDGLIVFATALIGILIGAVFLQAACVLYNKLADKPNGVPNLGLGHAMSIICIAATANAVSGFLIGRMIVAARPAVAGSLWAIPPIAFLDALPASILVMAATLPTSFGKGLLVSLLNALIWLVLGIVLGTIVLAIVLAVT